MNSNGWRDRLPNLDRCTITDRHGEPCGLPSVENAPFPICDAHAVQTYRYVSRRIGSLADDPMFQIKMRLESAESERSRERYKLAARVEVVYYVQIGEHIKIGYTSRLRLRMNAYPATRRLLATEPGTYADEAARHHQFRHLLAAGNEWFRPGPDLMDHINDLRSAQGADPIEHARTLLN